MFEKCGLRDIFYAIYKYKFFIIFVTIAFLIIGMIFSVEKGNSTVIPTENQGKWIASACYFVSLSDDTEIGNSTVDQVKDKEISLAYTCSNLLRADFSAEKMYDSLLEKYSKEEIIDGFGLSVSPNVLTSFDLLSAYSVSVLESSSVVNFFVTANDETMAQELLTECKSTFENLPSVVETASVQYIDGVVELKYDEAVNDFSVENEKNNNVFIFVILGLMFSLLVVVGVAVFCPTINRKSDFSVYGVSVIGEASISKKNKGDGNEK